MDLLCFLRSPKLQDVRLIVKSRNRRRGLLITSADPSGEHSSSSLLTSKENLEDEDLRGFGLQVACFLVAGGGLGVGGGGL